jgi:hypothetical protein
MFTSSNKWLINVDLPITNPDQVSPLRELMIYRTLLIAEYMC